MDAIKEHQHSWCCYAKTAYQRLQVSACQGQIETIHKLITPRSNKIWAFYATQILYAISVLHTHF